MALAGLAPGAMLVANGNARGRINRLAGVLVGLVAMQTGDAWLPRRSGRTVGTRLSDFA